MPGEQSLIFFCFLALEEPENKVLQYSHSASSKILDEVDKFKPVFDAQLFAQKLVRIIQIFVLCLKFELEFAGFNVS